jgi:Asp-tRNA(Asn)/Glu-tRNA(Gln) amidotransferase A subunit family amidase
MARTVGDLKILFDVLKGPDASDALTVPITQSDWAQLAEVGTVGTGAAGPRQERGKLPHSKQEKLRIGILEDDALGRVTPETQMAVRQAAQMLAYQGFILEPFRLNNLERVLELWWFFFGTVISELFAVEVCGREDLLSPIFREYLEEAGASSPPAPMKMGIFVGRCSERDQERARILQAMRDVPILLSPVCSAPAFRHGEGSYKPVVGYRDTMRHSQWLNLAGFPGVSLPMRQSPEGLPIGVQLIGRPYEDELVLAVAEKLEAVRGPWHSPPMP